MTIFIPKETRARTPRALMTFRCKWCDKQQERRLMYKLVDGPLDHYTCSEHCARMWVLYRHKIDVHAVLTEPALKREQYALVHFKMSPPFSMDALISHLGLDNA